MGVGKGGGINPAPRTPPPWRPPRRKPQHQPTPTTMKILQFAALAALAFTHNQNVLAVGAATKEAETITIGTAVFEIDLGGGVSTGRYAVTLTASATAAAGTLTFAENAVDTNTVTIGTTVYTFVAAAAAAGEVTIGADASGSIDNLIAAINGTDGINTAHGRVTAAAGAGDTMVITATIKGTGFNTYATTDTLAGASAWGAVTMAGGADPSAANSITAIVAAINASTYATGLQAIAVAGGVLVLDTTQRGGQSCTETLSGAGNAWLAATSYGGSSDVDQPEIPVLFTRTATAAEAAGKLLAFSLPFTPTQAVVQIRDSSGVLKAWDGKLTLGANHALLNSDAGTDIAENDVVSLLATV